MKFVTLEITLEPGARPNKRERAKQINACGGLHHQEGTSYQLAARLLSRLPWAESVEAVQVTEVQLGTWSNGRKQRGKS